MFKGTIVLTGSQHKLVKNTLQNLVKLALT